MKKLGISLLVLALVLSFVSANAGVGARIGVTAAAVPTLVIGMNQIDILVGYGQSSPTVVGAATKADGSIITLGATYWINKNLGANLTYASTTTAVSPAPAAAATTVLSLGLEAKAELVKGVSLIGSLPLYTSTSAATGSTGPSTLLLNTASVAAQFDLF